MQRGSCSLLTVGINLHPFFWTHGLEMHLKAPSLIYRSKSGWFDEAIFENFLNELLLPCMKKQSGTKVIIGDNLASHISKDVIRKCSH